MPWVFPWPRLACRHEPQGRVDVSCVPVPARLVMVTSQLCCFCWWLPRQFSFARCSALEGLSVRQVITVTWDTQPHTSVSEGVAPGGGCAQVLFRCGPAIPSHCLTLRWFRSRVGRSGVGPQFDQTATPNCCFGNPFLGVIRGGTGVRSLLTSWRVRGAGWFCLWALDLVEVLGVYVCGETLFLTWLLGVSRGDTWLFLPNLVEVRDVGACVMRLWSHMVAPVFRELLCLSGCVPRCCFRIVFDSVGSAGVVFGLTRFLLLCLGLAVAGVRCRTAVVAACSPCVANSVSCERESSCTLFEIIAYLTGLNSNPSGSSDLWVAARASGVPGGGPEDRVVIVVSELRDLMRFVMG
ncbi:hypothetical protein Taro_051684 [Colocasia esculenta]|uniref:Uncharacterized protein n=1 Tax=Colocasia esculenta TaxID=4460 RepID=A0A843XGQ4_COLES|nr:hypothetical protein [Colocasia esculenta]